MQSLEDLIITEASKPRTEKDWIEAIYYLVNALMKITGHVIDIGEYWIDDCSENGSIGVRLRSRSGLSQVMSDSWEAILCVTFRGSKIWADIYTFPFFQGSPVIRRGCIHDVEAEVEEFWWYQWRHSGWESHGWSYPDGAGEWAYIRKHGDVYLETLCCHPIATTYQVGGPLTLHVLLNNQEITLKDSAGQADKHIGVAYFSLMTVKRGRTPGNLGLWSPKIPQHHHQHVVKVSQCTDPRTQKIQLDFSTWNIRHGWKPGKYYVIMRMQGAYQSGEDWTYSSAISSPLTFTIVEHA